jgi:hypothetical protein
MRVFVEGVKAAYSCSLDAAAARRNLADYTRIKLGEPGMDLAQVEVAKSRPAEADQGINAGYS